MSDSKALQWFLEQIQQYPYDSDEYRAYDIAIDALIEITRKKEEE